MIWPTHGSTLAGGGPRRKRFPGNGSFVVVLKSMFRTISDDNPKIRCVVFGFLGLLEFRKSVFEKIDERLFIGQEVFVKKILL